MQVHWTPVFARGKIRLFVCDPQAITAPHKLNDSIQLAKFIRSHLTEVLQSMQQDYGWPTIPRVVVHDKASYMVNSTCQQLNPVFKGALVEAGFRSWISEVGSDTTWVAAKLGDVYLHETAISHVRRLLATKFVCTHVEETVGQFNKRMEAVENFMNSEDFKQHGGRGLLGLSRGLRDRCQQVIDLKGSRIPK